MSDDEYLEEELAEFEEEEEEEEEFYDEQKANQNQFQAYISQFPLWKQFYLIEKYNYKNIKIKEKRDKEQQDFLHYLLEMRKGKKKKFSSRKKQFFIYIINILKHNLSLLFLQ